MRDEAVYETWQNVKTRNVSGESGERYTQRQRCGSRAGAYQTGQKRKRRHACSQQPRGSSECHAVYQKKRHTRKICAVVLLACLGVTVAMVALYHELVRARRARVGASHSCVCGPQPFLARGHPRPDSEAIGGRVESQQTDAEGAPQRRCSG